MEPISRDQLHEAVAETRARVDVPAMAVGVLANDAVTAVADGATPETVFRIASITKPFVATLAMTLVQDGLLALDEPPPGTQARATVRQLLGNVGGLKSEWNDRPDFGEGDDALARLAALEPPRLPFGPGELFSYANSGFWLVGAACAAVAGTTFEEAMQARVLEPLALEATTFEAAVRATGHVSGEPVADVYPRARRASGGLWSTVGDLLRLARHHLGGPGPLTDESRAEMQRPLSSGPGFGYGLGWFLGSRGGSRSVEHPGSAFGFQSRLVLLPDEGWALAALANSDRGAVAIEDVLRSLGRGVEEPQTIDLGDEQLEAFAGRYRAFGLDVEIAADDGALRVAETQTSPLTGEVRHLPAVRALPVSEREFVIVEGDDRGDRFDFPRDGLLRLSAIAVRVE
jgi:CubicO group peptidase (beta-lactamase class C family)